jgi:penicillin-binding protein 1A
LTIAEAAFLAALPKAPNNYHPVRFPEAARARRDWVLGRMQEDGWITAADVEAGRAQAVIMRARGEADTTRADYFAEEVRRELVARYGEAEVYRGGLSVRTTLSPRMQEIADRALRTGLVAYDRRHGWRAPLGRLDVGPGWERRLAQFQRPPGLSPWLPALILALDDQMAEVGLANGTRGRIPFSEMQWARRTIENQRLGPVLRKPADVLHVGDVVAVEAIDAPVGARDQYYFTLRQIPNLGGAVVALDPHTGRVLAMSGGWSFEASQFNRATQAQRQPGSAFKPFVYLPALDNGFTPSSLVLDAAFVIDQGPGQGLWKPANYSRNFFGPSPLRVGIEQSRNLMTVRLAEAIGIEKVADYARRFGVIDQMPHQLSMALGAGETTLMRLATGYAMLVNGGYKITPTLIDRVQDRHGRTVFKHDARVCPGCVPAAADGAIPELPEARPRVVDAATAYQMVSMLQGVVDRGTARRVKDLNRPLAGKTGTTNASNDVWFIGFSPDLVVGVFVGFDNPRTLGPNETGSSVAVPIFRDVMAEALAGEAKAPFRMASGIRLYRVNLTTGLLAGAADREAILEAFKSGTSPSATPQVLGGGNPAASPALAVPIPASEKDGIY